MTEPVSNPYKFDATQPLSNPQRFDAEIAWLKEAARYFSNRPTGGEDAAHWSNVYNAENANRIASRLDAMISTHPAPIKPSGDTGELRERVARKMFDADSKENGLARDWMFEGGCHASYFAMADAAISLIQSERAR